MKTIRAFHLDNNFYVLNAAQAKSITVGQQLPKFGYERKADPTQLKHVELWKFDHRVKSGESKIECNLETRTAWIQRTPCSWFDGKSVECGWVWALHLC